ncbi:capsular biosynthesis protein [Burkholderia gladioli]|uniref:capsular polysaccharide export protein, LipB/KpsS family n=2 Tax=Burkholderia gladioli TaxID=28095 RepID=UPI001E5900ED|nr:capsular biosynthesis protein [Burkholderia gladioli]
MKINMSYPASAPGIWSNGILPRKRAPLLSWFCAPLKTRTTQAWIDCIDSALAENSASEDTRKTQQLMRRFRNACAFDDAATLSKPHADLAASTRQQVLLIDEPTADTFGTPQSVRRYAFDYMVQIARRTHPDAEFWIARSAMQTRGEWLSDGHSSTLLAMQPRDLPGSLCSSLPYFTNIYTVSAPEGFQALLHEIPVHVFGTPCYAGWGLTHDHAIQPKRRSRPTITALFHILFEHFSRHIDPRAGTIGSLDSLLTAIETHRATTLRFADIQKVAGVRFQWWKRPFARPYLTAGGAELRWINHVHELKHGEYAACWGANSPSDLPSDAQIIRIEDGFLHSTGLGSDHVAPYSQVVDRRGIYFDASRPNDLCTILNEAVFTETELSRAQALCDTIARLGLTKYNLGRQRPTWRAPREKRVILVPGQVANDASIRLGTRGISTIEDLLREVRLQRTDAFIVYKPHPDVLSGNRPGLVQAADMADVVDIHSDLVSLMEIADEVHTLSSLSGFEALIRGKQVHTYGLPFYAGWGLTHDQLPQPWRKRKLSLAMLAAGTLIRYPIYWDWKWKIFTTPESIAERLAVDAARPLKSVGGSRTRFFMKAWRWSRNGLLHMLSRD